VFCYVWEYEVAPEKAEAFVAAYGPDGPWVRLFRRDPAYLGTELGRDADDPRRFLTIDRWTTREACLAFRERVRGEFDAIDAECERLTVRERAIGDFELVAAAAAP
jgi:quinol monooxygenase YgiN